MGVRIPFGWVVVGHGRVLEIPGLFEVVLVDVSLEAFQFGVLDEELPELLVELAPDVDPVPEAGVVVLLVDVPEDEVVVPLEGFALLVPGSGWHGIAPPGVPVWGTGVAVLAGGVAVCGVGEAVWAGGVAVCGLGEAVCAGGVAVCELEVDDCLALTNTAVRAIVPSSRVILVFMEASKID